jgi:hypothetical protein
MSGSFMFQVIFGQIELSVIVCLGGYYFYLEEIRKISDPQYENFHFLELLLIEAFLVIGLWLSNSNMVY